MPKFVVTSIAKPGGRRPGYKPKWHATAQKEVKCSASGERKSPANDWTSPPLGKVKEPVQTSSPSGRPSGRDTCQPVSWLRSSEPPHATRYRSSLRKKLER